MVARNLRIYPWYQTLFYLDFACPIHFLYFLQFLSISEVLALEAIRQITSVMCEIPSGYFSDRFGRKLTLQLSAAALCLGYSLFLNGSTFFVLALGQIAHAISWAFKSGSDVSLLHDSLNELGQESEFERRETRAVQMRLLGLALAGIIGGWIATKGLWWAMFCSAIASFMLLALTSLFEEPQSDRASSVESEILTQLSACFEYLKKPMLLWFFAYGCLSMVLDHIPYQFYQPYVELLGIKFSNKDATPLITGIVLAATMGIASLCAGLGPKFARRFGITHTLLGASALHLVIILLMAVILHPAVVVFMVLREIPKAIQTAPITARVLPAIDVGHRATFMSIQGLGNRLALGLFMGGLSFFGSDTAATTFPELRKFLWISFTLCFLGFAILYLTRHKVVESPE